MDFASSYTQLNYKQREAVDEIDGPVLVVAGPGTGKTQLLSVRVANILSKTDTRPENILCLTFTNKAATNMRERLTDIIGPSARNVMVKTFHSFSAEIMNQYPDYFWNGAKLTAVPDNVQLDIIQSILTNLPIDNPLAMTFAGKFSSLKPVKEGLKLTKEAGLTPAKLRALIEANIAYIDLVEADIVEALSGTVYAKNLDTLKASIEALPSQQIHTAIMRPLDEVLLETLEQAIARDEGTGKAANTSAWKRTWVKSLEGQKCLADERKRNAWWLALADVYETYRAVLHDRGFYDYSDMLVEVIAQLEQNESLRSDVQERFLYVLIDEFQDTNPAQMHLAHLVSDHELADGKPNIMVVGDDDQSIFKFNGAELNNMLNFRHEYQVKKPIVLEENYRSSQAVLDAAQVIIEQAEDRLVTREPDISKNLVARNQPKQAGRLEHQRYETYEAQLHGVAEYIRKLKESQQGSVAVLARGHKSLEQLAHILVSYDVPISYERQRTVTDNEAASQIIELSRLLVSISAGDQNQVNALLSTLLRHPMWEINTSLLWQLAISNRSKPDWYKSLLTSENSQLQAIGDWLAWMGKEGASLPLTVTLEHLIGLRTNGNFTSPVRDYFSQESLGTQRYIEGLSGIQLLRKMAQEFVMHGAANLQDFVRMITISIENNQLIYDQSPFITGKDAVELLSVHKSKGLEFDSVIIIDAIEDNWKPRQGGRKPPANLSLKPYGDNYDDYVRLLYVAATRAKRTLIATSYSSDSVSEPVLATPLIHDALPSREIITATEDIPTILEETFAWPELATNNEEILLRPILDGFNMNPTALLQFLDVTSGGPQTFKERALLRIPEVKSVHQSYGTAIHDALETGQHLLHRDEFSLPAVIRAFTSSIESQSLLPTELQTYTVKGQQALTTLFEDYAYVLPHNGKPEQKISDVVLDGGVRLSGKLDRIDQDASTVRVIDYKTGKALPNFESKAESYAIKIWKHKLQLIFYGLLISQSSQFAKAEEIIGEMVYVEADSAKKLQLEYRPTAEDISKLTSVITVCWELIQARIFPDTSEYSQDMAGIDHFISDLLSGTFKKSS